MHADTIPAQAAREAGWQQEDTVAYYRRVRQSLPYAEDQFEFARRTLAAHDVEVRTLLDLGAGDGIAASAIADRFPIERIVLVDYSEPMLEAARARFAGSARHVAVINGDLRRDDWLEAARFEPGYDLVVSRYAIHHLPDERKRTLYGEILDLLRPGGMFVNIDHVQSAAPRYEVAFDRLIVEGIHATTNGSQTFEETERAYREFQDVELDILVPVDVQCQWLRDLGFVDVDCSFRVLEMAVFAGRKPVPS